MRRLRGLACRALAVKAFDSLGTIDFEISVSSGLAIGDDRAPTLSSHNVSLGCPGQRAESVVEKSFRRF